ncbi:hypothetical protein Moror_12150 [Moniliophthora roreri MCA 2997]|uniref:Uncharacterized protein n=1 Tax=Moniliophthora roreri (strain MCA 2997) TaxID=1381753 RepID=V2WPF1_MONRO|nr:hypothetical protein Moror_12150 [Moniliophthora roreri MCA 2997]
MKPLFEAPPVKPDGPWSFLWPFVAFWGRNASNSTLCPKIPQEPQEKAINAGASTVIATFFIRSLMSSHKSSFSQTKPLLETPPVQLYQCRYSYPSAPLVIRNAEDYLQEHPANYIPLDHEVPYLRGALQETLAELDLSDSELGRLRDVVRQMEERRRRLMEIAFRLNGLVKTTIRRLPPELLSHIFFMARDEGHEDSLACQVPLTLSHVCSRWRALVHSEPGLWCTVNASFCDEDDQLSADRLLEFTKFCLEKSQSMPINVTLTTPEHSYDPGSGSQSDQGKLHAEVLNELLANSYRWRVANLLLHPDDEERLIDHHMDFPILERLDMCFQLQVWNPCNPITPTFSAPRLSRMDLRNVDYGCFRLINLDALTEITMESCHIIGFLHILQHARNLCSVKLMGKWCPCDHVPNPFVTSSVQSLELALDPQIEHHIFQLLTLPSLTILQVRLLSHQWQFRQFILRSRPPLTHLLLSTTIISHVGVMDTFALLPTITHLKLEQEFLVWDKEDVESFLRGMTVGPESTDNVLLPDLTDLDLRFRALELVQVGDIMAMLESRCLVAHGLRQRLAVLRLVLWNTSEAEEKLVQQRINVLRDNGLDVQVEFI